MARYLPSHRFARPVDPDREAALIAGRDAALARRRARGCPPLTRVIPRPTRCTLGGLPITLGELRLADLAELQQWLTERTAHPCAGVTATEPAERRAQLLAAWEAAKVYPVRFGSPAARPHVVTAEWFVLLLWLCLRRADSTATEEVATALALRCSPADAATVYRIAYGTDAWAEILRELDPDDSEHEPLDWCKAILDLLEAYPGWTFDTVANLTVSQWRALRCGSEAFAYRCEPRAGESLKDAREREKRMLAPLPDGA